MNLWRFLRRLFSAMAKKNDKLERAELREEKKEVFALDTIAVEAHWIRDELRCICRELKRLNEFVRAPKSFQISQEGSPMGVINGIVQGGTGTITATPQPAGSDLQGVVPAWTSSDPANTSVTPSADGLSANMSVGAGLAVGSSFTLSVSATSPDGSVTATGSATVPVLAPAPTFPTSFDLNQTA